MDTHLSRYPLMWGETPLHRLHGLERVTGLKECWVKRDDLTGIAFGGNKVRKLEYLLGDALAKGCDTVITGGSPQSNHARLTAACARRAGLEPWLCFAGKHMGIQQGNLLLDHILGAEMKTTGVYGSKPLLEEMEKWAEVARQKGKKPYVVPVGGSTPIGDYGYKRAWDVLLDQLAQSGAHPESIVLAVGSGGTLAGLLAGKVLHPAPIKLIGISVWLKADELIPEVVRMANDLLAFLGSDRRLSAAEVHVEDAYIGKKYGVPSDAGNEAIRLLARSEGLFVDPIYTGKALAGLLDLFHCGKIGSRVLFWHTGGTPALFTHAHSFTREG
ncbi:1-aminocyclopropane-1-carboxylate deaminase/D-cysteine desulfhydrase [Polycladomyces subterraneus]|uniref:D-cysteine desulfhydrase family protein n=1 Tax=Polycladomyces subterraneus TaxID=1016997 RepID=A0ABT8IKJ9_9BACL|nr:D-cysteine desulfhydrase family protein [Polycladomyces subterraneus]MDN4593263.1 D-cysteine desulfhydrase family protein [Polycladomyces subterraneus]